MGEAEEEKAPAILKNPKSTSTDKFLHYMLLNPWPKLLAELIPALYYTDLHIALEYLIGRQKLLAKFRTLYLRKRTISTRIGAKNSHQFFCLSILTVYVHRQYMYWLEMVRP